ncbi:sensor histidine kinase [Streptomyces sp. NPDC003327]
MLFFIATPIPRGPTPTPPPPRPPPPSLDVRTRVTGEPVPLPRPVDLAAYRIVQESLTNATRHSGARTVTITLDWAPEAVRLRIADDGGGAPEGRPTGSGIQGMRERARALGGDLTAGNTCDTISASGAPEEAARAPRGFLVDARLPLRTPPATEAEARADAGRAPATETRAAPAPAPEGDSR